MVISYKPLGHLLVEKEMNKEYLRELFNITSNIVSKIVKNSYVNLDLIEKIYLPSDYKIKDIIQIVREDRDE